MKILLINTYGSGGAANACIRLHVGLLSNNIDSVLLLKNQSIHYIPNTIIYQEPINILPLLDKKTKLKRKIKRILKEFYLYKPTIKDVEIADTIITKRDKRLEKYSYANSGIDITGIPQFEDADIVHLHWVADFLNYSDFFLKTTKPIIWTLHDMNPFTGGEHYMEEYLGMDEKGYLLKREISEFEKIQFKNEIQLKINALLQKPNLHIVTLTDWMTQEVKKSKVFSGYPIHKILNGIDINIFNKKDKSFCRNTLGLPQKKIILLFVADFIEYFRKGYMVLLKSLELINNRDIILCSIGNKTGELIKSENWIELGVIKDERLMSIAYSSADAFVIPSLMDNLPNTVVESLLCGTPVIGFPVGGIPEMIHDGVNGILAKELSAPSLADAIIHFIKTYNYFDSNLISKNAIDKYATEVMVSNYKELYESILNAE